MRGMLSIIAGLALATVFAVQVQAADISFSISQSIPAQRGETVTVPISVSNNPGFVAVGLVVTYDPSVLVITGVTAPVANMSLNPQFQLTTDPGTQWIHLFNTRLTDWSGNGVVANVTFDVLANAPLGTSSVGLAFTVSPDGTPTNAAGDLLESLGRAGNMTVGGSVNVQTTNNTNSAPGASNPISDGDFIGNPYVHDDTGMAQSTSPGGSNPDLADFGRVPQTGISSGLLTALALVSYLAVGSAVVYTLRRKSARQ